MKSKSGWRSCFKEGSELVLATCSKQGKPNANIVISLGLSGDKLLVADCQMKTTIGNLNENKKICVVGGYHRLKGSVEILGSGKYFTAAKKKSKGYTVRNAILISIAEVFDLDKQKKVF